MRAPSRAECGVHHPVLMAAQDHEQVAGCGIPDTRRLVFRCGDDAASVRAESRGLTRGLVTAQDHQRWPFAAIPDARRLVL